MYTVGAFDVGIRNLAFCVMSLKDDNFYIDHWQSIDLLEQEKLVCSATMKNGNKCKALSYHISGTGYHYCNRHKPTIGTLKNVKRKNTNTKTINIQQLSELLIKSLNKLTVFDNCSEILIETQPKCASARMQSVSYLLYSYFIINGSLNENSFIKKVNFVSGTNKLKIQPVLDKPLFITDSEILPVKTTGRQYYNKSRRFRGNSKINYNARKNAAIDNTKVFIKNNNEYLELFNTFKKKDDPADAFLYCLWKIMKKKPNCTCIPSNEELIISDNLEQSNEELELSDNLEQSNDELVISDKLEQSILSLKSRTLYDELMIKHGISI